MTDAPSEHALDDARHGPEPRPAVGAPREGLTVGFVPGVMPGKWFDRWDARWGRSVPLERLALDDGGGVQALRDRRAHMAILRTDQEPEALDADRFHAITLYREKPVVVLPVDHVLTLLDEVPLDELADEFLLQDPSEVPEWAEISAAHRAANPRRLPEMRHTRDAVELVAAGLGLLVVPMSVARLHHRKDLTYREVQGVAERPVALVWPKDRTSDDDAAPEAASGLRDEDVIQEFIGVVRGRTASSSRGSAAQSSRGTASSGSPGRAASGRGGNGRAASSAKRPGKSGAASRTRPRKSRPKRR